MHFGKYRIVATCWLGDFLPHNLLQIWLMNATLYVHSTHMSLLQYLVTLTAMVFTQRANTGPASLAQVTNHFWHFFASGLQFNRLKTTNVKNENFQKCFCLNKRLTVTVQGLLFVCLHTHSPQTQDQHTCPSNQPLQTLLCIRATNSMDQKQSLSELTASRPAGLCLFSVWLHVHLHVLLRPVSASQRRWTRADRGGGQGWRNDNNNIGFYAPF